MNTETSKRTIRIGSHVDCDIQIDDPNVSGTHAYMYLDGEKICLELRPDCLAILNGNEVTGCYWLQESDKVVIGDMLLDLCGIRQWLEGQQADYVFVRPFVDSDSPEDMSDAVAIKHNWWPAVIVIFIILAVSVIIGSRFIKYNRLKTVQEKELQIIQDSLARSQEKIDNLNESLKQIERK